MRQIRRVLPGEDPTGCAVGPGDGVACGYGHKKASKIFIEKADVAQFKAEWFEDTCQRSRFCQGLGFW